MRAHHVWYWHGLLRGLPVLLIASTVSLSACAAAGRGVGVPAPTASAPAPLWQTATARVQSARFPPPMVLSADLPSPTPSTPAATATARIETPTTAAASPSPLRSSAIHPSGSQLLDRSFFSAALGRQMPYFIYLPVEYAESGLRYPVLYMLHGYGGSNTEWIGYGLPEIADRMINAGEMPPMIIVLPQGDQSYWVNHADDGARWGDYMAQDVVSQIDTTYRTLPDPRHRAIGGLSMGAHGALQLAMTFPDTFAVVGMHSPTLRDYPSMADFVGFFGDEAYFDAHDPEHLVRDYPDRARRLKIFLDVGEQDGEWYESDMRFHEQLTQLSIRHAWQTWPGLHDGAYWSAHCADYLRFYAAALSG